MKELYKSVIFKLPKRFLVRVRNILNILSLTINEWIDDKAFKMGAALSYYTVFSIAPMIIIIVAVVGFVFGEDAIKGQIVDQIQGVVGLGSAELIQSLLQNVAKPSTGITATIISSAIILFASLGLFVELKESLNIIWGVEPRPGQGLWGILKTRISSFIMVLIIGAVLFASVLFGAMVTTLNKFFSEEFPNLIPIFQYSNIFVSFVIVTVVFAMIFKFLPDVYIKWKYVWLGAFITAVLFYTGKYFIGLYLLNSSYKSVFGAAGSLIVFLMWINYSSLILFLGAEFTQVYRRETTKTPLKAKRNAILIPKVTQIVEELVKKEKNKEKTKIPPSK